MARKVLKKDWASYTDGDFALVNNPWNKGKLENGPNYAQSISFDTDDITRDVLFKWDWPDAGHVVAYPEIIVSGQTGAVVPTGDLAAYIAAIEPYLADPGLAFRHGENALVHVRSTFDIGNEVDGLGAVYRSLVPSGT